MIGLFGGTFDPVHFGHLRPAVEVREALQLDELRLVPCGVPGHRAPPLASAEQRLAMLRAAIQGVAGLRVDTREIAKPTPCYSVETLEALRQQYPGRPLVLVIGMDAFATLDNWHRWRDIPRLAHLVVAHRPGWQADDLYGHPRLGPLLQAGYCEQVAALRRQVAGRIFFQPVTQLDISSTRIRALLAAGKDVSFLLPARVIEVIQQQRIYS
ncbi:MAG TPA: nicotinate-nucleotide adenylyltransferase [Gammaproteobacteria bacterium]|nr:nicotinate-nucleotide adenylyltransferase [Gammaproteobacteria bacterium]